jgi:hypothetical protein
MKPVQDFPGMPVPGNKGQKIPVHWLFFDTETLPTDFKDTQVHRFNLGWTCYWYRGHNRGKSDQYWNYWDWEEPMNRYIHDLALEVENLYLLGHNVFFDLQASGFYQYMSDWGWELQFIYDKGLTYILKATKDGATITALSTTNWFDQSLEKLGNTLGLPKLDVDFEGSSREELKTYCKRDVEILVKSMEYYIHFIQEHDLGNFALTKASQAFNAFRHRFKDEKLVIHKKQKVKELERLAYTGGRCEAFHIGEPEGGPFISLDINSMYPYVMKEFEYPVELVEYTENPALERFNNVLLTHAVVAEVEIQTDEPAYALKYNGKTVFPTGSFTTWVTTPGMKYALEHGHIKKVNRAAIYRKAPLFARYVDYFYNLKLQYKSQGNQMMTLFTKYMLNSLYGKFGQKKPVTDEYQTDTGREYSREEILDVDTGDVYTVTSLMNKMIVQKGETEGYMSFPAIAAHVTEYGRFMLWQIIKQTGPENVLYCDTDSIKICKSDIDKVKWSRSETTLGALKIEDETDYLYIGGAKNYITDTARKIKGIPSKAKEISPGVYRFPVFYRQNTHLRNGSPAGVTVGNMVRSLKGSYDKGIVTGSGQVFPYHFSDVDSPPS